MEGGEQFSGLGAEEAENEANRTELITSNACER